MRIDILFSFVVFENYFLFVMTLCVFLKHIWLFLILCLPFVLV
jgi:hypothetical protein